MISNNALSVFILHHHVNVISNNNLCSIQEVMRVRNLSAKKYKRVCKDFPNLVILIKSATPGEVQLIFVLAAVANKFLGNPVVDFALAGDLSSSSVISLKIYIAFTADSDKVFLPIAKVILRAAASNLAHLKNQ